MTGLGELFSQVSESLLRNKLRTFLTMAGIAWGIASIVLVVAMGDSFKAGQNNNMKTLGENIVILFAGRTELQAGGERAGRRIRFNYSDVENIRRECPAIERVTGELEGNVRGTSAFNSGSFEVSGVEEFFPLLRDIPIADGRFFNIQDEQDAARVIVIGLEVKKQLFGDRSDIVGREVAINSIPYRVIGVMEKKDQNSSYSGLDEKKMFLPYTAMKRDMPPTTYYEPGFLSEILYRPRGTDFGTARREALRVIARAHNFDPSDESAVRVWDTVENQRMMEGIIDSMTRFLGFIGLVTLSLGGIGVMNIMLVTVSERTREIGLRKALGATRLRIMMDFLVEGCVMSLVSGFIGWAGVFAISTALSHVKMPDALPGLPVSGETTAVAFTALTLIAIASALFPAWRAASLTPVEALRYER
jgi:putative ABC transport system permease protein